MAGHRNYIYAASSQSLLVIDASDPRKAHVINTIEPMEDIKDILFKDDLMILIYRDKVQLAETDDKGGVRIVKTIDIDLSDFESPICIGDYLYILSSYRKLNAVNLKIPPLAFVEFSFDDLSYAFIRKHGDYLLAFFSNRMDILTFTEGKKPELVKTLEFDRSFCIRNVVVDDSIAFVFSDYHGFKVLDVSNPENPFIIAEYKEFETQSALFQDDFVFFKIDYDAWGVFYKEPFITGKDVMWDNALFITINRAGSSVDDMFIMDNCIYIATYEGLKIFDLSELSNLPPYG